MANGGGFHLVYNLSKNSIYGNSLTNYGIKASGKCGESAGGGESWLRGGWLLGGPKKVESKALP